MSHARTISIERDILSKNNALAAANRGRLRNAGVFALNFVSSPGSGKTSLLRSKSLIHQPKSISHARSE
jgi:hydrogenase nickel incorporation protein HypB